MKGALLGLSLMLFAVALGITGAIWVGIHLGGWGLAVIAGLALGIPLAFVGGGLSARRAGGGDPYGVAPGWGAYPGPAGGRPEIAAYGVPRERPGAPWIPWISWIAWIPGVYPAPPDVHRGGWPMLPPAAPRTFTVIGEDGEEE